MFCATVSDLVFMLDDTLFDNASSRHAGSEPALFVISADNLDDDRLIEQELLALAAAVREAEEALDILEHHSDPARREFVRLLSRLRLKERRIGENTLPARYHRPSIRLTRQEVAALAHYRTLLYRTAAAKRLRDIVHVARNRFPQAGSAEVSEQQIKLSFTREELLDMAECWAALPLSFQHHLQEVKAIHQAAQQRQLVKSGFAVMRAAKAFVESEQRNYGFAFDIQRSRQSTPSELGWVCSALEQLRSAPCSRRASAIIEEACQRGLDDSPPPAGVINMMLSPVQLADLNDCRDQFLKAFTEVLHKLRLHNMEPIKNIVVEPDACAAQSSQVLRFDGSEKITTMALSGLQFWGEFLSGARPAQSAKGINGPQPGQPLGKARMAKRWKVRVTAA